MIHYRHLGSNVTPLTSLEKYCRPVDFRVENDVRFVLTPICFVGVFDSFMLFGFIYVYWCPARFPYQIMFASLNSNTTGVRCGAGTAHPSGTHEFIPGS
jgi:hypothetical protein